MKIKKHYLVPLNSNDWNNIYNRIHMISMEKSSFNIFEHIHSLYQSYQIKERRLWYAKLTYELNEDQKYSMLFLYAKKCNE